MKNLDDGIDDERLRKEFSPYGTITSAKVREWGSRWGSQDQPLEVDRDYHPAELWFPADGFVFQAKSEGHAPCTPRCPEELIDSANILYLC